jgi:hypothetical protein
MAAPLYNEVLWLFHFSPFHGRNENVHMKRVLIRCGWLVTLDPAVGDFRNGELLFSGDRIEAAGRNLGATADETIDAGDKIVMPGLVNAHMHTWETALRGIGAEWMTADYLRHMHLNLATRYRPEDNYLGNLIGALAQIDAGVTTLVDWCHNITGIELAERAVDGLVDSGIRAVFAHGTAKPPTADGARPFTDIPHPRERIEALRKGSLAGDDGRVTLAMAILGPDWGSWRWSSTTSAWRASSAWCRRRIPDGGRTAWCPTAIGAWPRRDCSGRTTISCMAPATTRRISR